MLDYITELERENEALRIENSNLKRRMNRMRKVQDMELQRMTIKQKRQKWKEPLLYWTTVCGSILLGGLAAWKLIGRIVVK